MLVTENRTVPDRAVWPVTTGARPGGDVSVGGVGLAGLAERFGTPLHVVDEEDVRRRCRAFRGAFHDADVAYAGKAFLCRAMAGWIAEEGLSLDVCSAGELAVARAAGFPPERVLMHGNAKTPEDLRAALAYGVGRVVVDSFHEITRLAAPATAGARPRLLVRVTPGVDGRTHAAMTTGTDDQKFGSRSRPAPRPRPSAASSGSAAWSWSGCTATSARRSPTSTCSTRPPGAWSPCSPRSATSTGRCC
ncbi:diaminopimelate decarboxylase family protein [Actinomadura xylanilytica]|uniref:diaminopimelate decarboxylase family protein n=1 Tax=Actinomadura xylanilytica TaxID=887459 RepID=UPI00255ACB00|nr:hypothetical protein [Actinomadura xylanilytica]MDL4774995.1 hypothetical protein [Actinomadura xylanilytica]